MYLCYGEANIKVGTPRRSASETRVGVGGSFLYLQATVVLSLLRSGMVLVISY